MAELLFPARCTVCSTPIGKNAGEKDDLPMCEECFRRYEAETFEPCPVCGRKADKCDCGSSAYSRGAIYGRHALSIIFYTKYDPESDRATERLIFRLKREYNKQLIDFFARDVSAHLMKLIVSENSNPGDFLLTFPPRTIKSAVKYGFDHAEELTARISYYTGIPMAHLLGRVSGVEQKKLSSGERFFNVSQSIYVKNRSEAKGKRIILFDDVITTGATMELSSELLLAAGAESVFPVSIAKTKRRKKADP